MDSNKSLVCCCFGHRDVQYAMIPLLQGKIEELVSDGVKTFYVGGYGNFDRCVVSAIINLKKKCNGIKLILVTAYLSTLENHKDYIASTYDETIYPEGLEFVPQKFAISHRNRWMVEQSQYMIAYVDHFWGGAYTALSYAKKRNVKIVNIADVKTKN